MLINSYDLIAVFLFVVINSFAQVFRKKGANVLGQINLVDIFSKRVFDILLERNFIIGSFCDTLGTLLWFVALSKLELNFAFSLTALNYVLTPILASIFFGEKIVIIRWIGIMLIVIGIIIVTKY